MKTQDDATGVEGLSNGLWHDDVDAALPEAVAECKVHGQIPPELLHLKVQVSFRELPHGETVKLKAALGATLMEVFEHGAKALGQPLLPPADERPLDILRHREHHSHHWSDPVTNLDQPLWLALAHGSSRHFGIEYVLAVKINTKWGVAPKATLTPRELLTHFGFDPAQFSLYRPDSTEPLPADTPISVKRGEAFEAQKDGRYGSSGTGGRLPRGTQTIEDDVKDLQEAGTDARLFTEGGQKYVEVKGVRVSSPPWSKSEVTILIAIPVTYLTGGLDAFYLEHPISHTSGSIPYQSQAAQIDGRTWGLISWHYAGQRPWNSRQDDLSTHIEHCRGALLQRGVIR